MTVDCDLGLAAAAAADAAGLEGRMPSFREGYADLFEREAERTAAALEGACCAYEREALAAGACPADVNRWDWLGPGLTGTIARRRMVEQYAWSIPTGAALDTLAELSPLVELGAGGGYWAMLLRARGTHVEPFDAHPYPLLNHFIKRAWIPVSRGGPRRALKAERATWTLLICWPSYRGAWAEDALDLHRGEYVAYIGEGAGGCTGTDRFHELLEERYELAARVDLPQWLGIHDDLELWHAR